MEPLEPQKKTWLFSIYMGLCYYPVIFRENFHKPLQYKDPIMKTWPRMTHGIRRAIFFFRGSLLQHIRTYHLEVIIKIFLGSASDPGPQKIQDFSLMYGIFDYTKTIKNQANIWEIYQSHGSYRIEV